MSPGLASRLNAERHRRFVGRFAERDLFRSALSADGSPFNVLYVSGPGGVGKTTLLREFANICEEFGVPASYVDARNVEPSSDAFLGAISSALGPAMRDGSPGSIETTTERRVVLIDTYETLAPLDSWMSEVFLPQLPENLLLVLASRDPLGTNWRTDPGWQRLIHPVQLRNLSLEESQAYLNRREVPSEQHQDILEFTHGHPLALSLVADVFVQRSGVRFRPSETPDVIKTLLEQFVQQVPGPAHRTALESCALVRYTTESLLGHMVTMPEVHELFEWLRGLTFIESGPLGLFPHDVAREALVADLRWRNPDWYAELHHRARNYYAARLKQTHAQEQQRVLFDYMYLHRDNAMIKPFLEWQETGTTLPDTMRENDRPALREMIEEHEGPESARLASRWFDRQPGGVVIFRDIEQRPAGFVMKVALQETSAEDREADPAVEVAWRYLERNAPLRPGERSTLFRFWMARDTYQEVSAMQSLIFGNVAQHYLTTPHLAFTFFPTADPDFWAPAFAYFDLARTPEADFEVDGHHYGTYTHDWRVMPPMAWLDLLAEREISTEPLDASHSTETEPLIVLGEPEFKTAIRDALRDFHSSEALHANPLLHSRTVAERAGAGADDSVSISALRDLLKEAAESLRASPREAKCYRALYHTYLNPAPTQQLAAEVLDLPFSTYRRHLKGGITRVGEILWHKEIGGQ
ncbi:MAG TPA: AAA family ATPase [Rubrobacteraceae bacterium]|nr:AAA family ATPase [Rubrobacteraceae bacterium]